MRALVGLGNPGSEYDGTRHNIGFAVIDALSDHLRIPLRSGKGNYRLGTGTLGGEQVLLVQPMGYMNNSGEAVQSLVGNYGLALRDLLVIVDDFQLPLGALRLRVKGSDGGHNGLYSIIYHLYSEDFPRLRCGIGGETMPIDKNEMARYVLSPFGKEERETVRQMILRARDAAVVAVTESLEAAISRFNRADDIHSPYP